MSTVSARLDQVMKTLTPDRAASVEKLVWDVIRIVESPGPSAGDRQDKVAAHAEHVRSILNDAAAFDWSGLERPSQGESEKREDW